MTTASSSHPLLDAYKSETQEDLIHRYDNWSVSYDDDVLSWDYKFPPLGAAMTARYVPRGAGPILDAGAGTGQVGEWLSILGYEDIIGIDLSERMLEKASERGVYKELHRMDLLQPLRFDTDTFKATTAIGVMTVGHVSPKAFDELLRVTLPGGHIIFSLSVEAYLNLGFKTRQDELSRSGLWELVEMTAPFPMLPLSRPIETLEGRVFVYNVS